MAEHLPARVARFFGASQRADVDGWAGAFAADSAFHHPAGADPVRGRTAIREFIAQAVAGFGEFRGLTIEDAYAVGAGSAAVTRRGRGTSTAGSPVEWAGITSFEVDADGLIARAWAYADFEDLGRQLAGRATAASADEETTR